MLRIDDKDPSPMEYRKRQPFEPFHKRLRIYFESGGKRWPAWPWRGILFEHNKRKKVARR